MAGTDYTYHDFDDKRIIVGLGAAIALLVVLYVFRVLKVYVLGMRVSGVIGEVVKHEGRGGVGYSYVVEYEDIRSEKSLAEVDAALCLQKFKVGDRVTLFIPEGKNGAAEILSWWRLLISGLVVAGGDAGGLSFSGRKITGHNGRTRRFVVYSSLMAGQGSSRKSNGYHRHVRKRQ